MYYCFLGTMQLPQAPGSIDTTINNKNETVSLINGGDINILKKPGLTELNFEVFVPHTKYPFSLYGTGGIVGASVFFGYLEKLKTSQLPFRFIVCRMTPNNKKMLWNTNLLVSLEDYKIKEDADNGLDQYVEINLKQYQIYHTKVLNTDSNNKTTVSSTRG